MKIYVYKILLDTDESCYAIGQVAHAVDANIIQIDCSQPIEVPDNSSVDDIIKFVKGCVNPQPRVN